jgi:two-component system sensor kinase FixL
MVSSPKARAAPRPGTVEKPIDRNASPQASGMKLLHELQLHQAELEAQNQALREAQARLEELRDRYFELYDSAPVGYFTLSSRGLIAEANLKCAALLGTDQSGLTGQAITRFILADDRPAFSRFCERAGTDSRPANSELRMLRRDGSQFWARLEAAPANTQGHGQTIRFALSDVTESRRADSLIRTSEQRLNLVIEAISDGFWDWDLRTGVVYRSPSYYATIGYRPEDATPDLDFFRRIAHPADLERALQVFEAHKRGETPVMEFEFRLASPAAGREWMSARGRVVERDADGVPLRIAGTISDITERKRSEARLRESEEQFRAVFDNSIDAILVTMPEVGIVAANPAAQRMFQYSEAEFRQVHRSDLVDMLDGSVAEALVERQRTGHYSGQLKFLRKDGSRFTGEVTSAMFTGKDGSLLTNVIVRDISRRQRAEAELAATRADMEQIIEWQVARNTAAALAHELNQPLTALSALSEAASRILANLTAEASAGKERLEPIVRRLAIESERAGSVVRNLLDSLHQPVSKTEAHDLLFILRKAADVARSTVTGSYRVVIDCAPELPPVMANYQQFEKILLNLAGNGADAMRNAGITTGSIGITAVTAEDGGSACISVCDDGPGVAPGMEQEIFQAFVTTRAEGMGMGLAIARALVEAQGGKLWHQTGRGTGAYFCFTLPFSRQDRPA